MTIFASIDPQYLTTDEDPWLYEDGCRDVDLFHEGSEGHEKALWSPRPGTVPATTHPRNSLLQTLREELKLADTDEAVERIFVERIGRLSRWNGILDEFGVVHELSTAFTVERDHARLVISRLIRYIAA
jgi:hypothetical protein